MKTATATIYLDICTPQGRTWLALVTGLGGKYGVNREFVTHVGRTTSKSGRTGTETYVVEDGIYQSNEGRYGRKWWRVIDGEAVEITEAAGLAAFQWVSDHRAD